MNSLTKQYTTISTINELTLNYFRILLPSFKLWNIVNVHWLYYNYVYNYDDGTLCDNNKWTVSLRKISFLWILRILFHEIFHKFLIYTLNFYHIWNTYGKYVHFIPIHIKITKDVFSKKLNKNDILPLIFGAIQLSLQHSRK